MTLRHATSSLLLSCHLLLQYFKLSQRMRICRTCTSQSWHVCAKVSKIIIRLAGKLSSHKKLVRFICCTEVCICVKHAFVSSLSGYDRRPGGFRHVCTVLRGVPIREFLCTEHTAIIMYIENVRTETAAHSVEGEASVMECCTLFPVDWLSASGHWLKSVSVNYFISRFTLVWLATKLLRCLAQREDKEKVWVST